LPLADEPLPTYRTYSQKRIPTTTTTVITKTTTTSTIETTSATNTLSSNSNQLHKTKSKARKPTKKPIFSTIIPKSSSTTTTEDKFIPTQYRLKTVKNSSKPAFTTFRPIVDREIERTFTSNSRPYSKIESKPTISRTTSSPTPEELPIVLNSFDTLTNADENKVSIDNSNRVFAVTPKYTATMFQQIGDQVSVNITNPSEKSWEHVVTLKPNLRREEDVFYETTPVSISTTKDPTIYISSPAWSFDEEPTTAKPKEKEVTTTTSWMVKEKPTIEPIIWTSPKPSTFVSTPTWVQKTDNSANFVTTPVNNNAVTHIEEASPKPPVFISTPTWSIQEVSTKAPTETPTKKSYSKPFKVTPIIGFMSTIGTTKRPTFESGIQWGTYKPNKEKKENDSIKLKLNKKRKSYGKRRKSPQWPKKSISTGKETFNPNFLQPTRLPSFRSTAQSIKNKIKSLYSSRRKITTAPKSTITKSPSISIDQSLEKVVSSSNLVSTQEPRSYVAADSNVWTATMKPPPPRITTPGWHIHSNADVATQQTRRSDDIVNNIIPDVSISSVSTLRPVKKSKKTRNNIFRKIKQLAPKLKSSHKTHKKSLQKPGVQLYKFTADEALNKNVTSQNDERKDAMFESQKLSEDTSTSGSTSQITVTKFLPQHAIKKQVSKWVPIKSTRRMDNDILPSYKITPDLMMGGFKISPLKPKQGPWLLRSPNGREYRFDSLRQIYNLNQNNFVPG